MYRLSFFKKFIFVMINSEKTNKLLTISLSLFAGLLNGFLGGGGGVVVVALLLSMFNLQQRKAQATALLVILPLTVVSMIVYFFLGHVSWHETLFVTLGVTAGGILGALLLSNLSDKTVKIVFAVILICGGIKMMFF